MYEDTYQGHNAMNEFEYLETLTGEQWTGVRFLRRPCAVGAYRFRLCEAVARSFEQDLTLSWHDINCPGALRSLGHADDDEKLAVHISQESGISCECVRRIIAASPRTDTPIISMTLGRIDEPDICIGYLRPEAAMWLLRQWQQTLGKSLENSLTGFMAVCGAVAGAFNDAKIVYSLGCPESRRHGCITADRMVAALPSSIVSDLMREDTRCQRMNTSVMNADIGSKSSRK